MYYLHSRYYDPEVCRFINADSYTSTGQGIIGYNMYAYCGNNPVNFSDTSGTYYNPIIVNDGGSGYEPINGQGNEPYKSMRYALSTVGFSGCEAIAVYNAMLLINKCHSFMEVKRAFENYVFFNGGFGFAGASTIDISRVLIDYQIDYSWVSHDDLSSLSEPTVMIVSYMTSMTVSVFDTTFIIPSIHTVAVEYFNGKYYAYNYYSNSTNAEPFTSLDELTRGEENFLSGLIIR